MERYLYLSIGFKHLTSWIMLQLIVIEASICIKKSFVWNETMRHTDYFYLYQFVMHHLDLCAANKDKSGYRILKWLYRLSIHWTGFILAYQRLSGLRGIMQKSCLGFLLWEPQVAKKSNNEQPCGFLGGKIWIDLNKTVVQGGNKSMKKKIMAI